MVLAAADAAHIPVFLKPVTFYDLSSGEGYEALYRRLTGQPEVVKRPLGRRRKLAPRKTGAARFSPGCRSPACRSPASSSSPASASSPASTTPGTIRRPTS